MLFQEFDFEVVVKHGRLNAGPDHLSRITNGEEPSSLEDNFPEPRETCHIFRWFFGTWFLPMVFYFRLRN
jgi:hypothetical protein